MARKLCALLLILVCQLAISQTVDLDMNSGNHYMPMTEPDSEDATLPTIKAEMVVNNLGATVYNVPIDVLKGVNSLQPNLALEYNSQSGNGMAGWGWNLAGMSVITRGGKSQEIDGATMGIQFNSTDPYYLDGQRLLTSNNTDYVTQKYSKIKIKRVSGDDYTFVITYTDGKIAKYDEIAPGQHYITMLSDSYGNNVEYTYAVFNNNVYINSVSYGGNDNDPHKFFITFAYASRQTPISSYRNGLLYVNNRILKEIIISSAYLTQNSGVYKKYLLSHDLINNGSTERLIKIEVANSSGEKLKPLKFSYNPASTIEIKKQVSNPVIWHPYANIGFGNVAVGDWDGNGRPRPVYEIKRPDNTYRMFVSGALEDSYGSSKQLFVGKVLKNNKVSDNDFLSAMDINYMDNLTDRLTFKVIDLKYGYSHLKTITIDVTGVMANNQNVGLGYIDPQGDWTPNSTSRDRTNRVVIAGDFNNDALMDVLIIQKGGNNVGDKFYFAEIGKASNGTLIPVQLSGNIAEPLFPKKIHSIEFNGDGIPELLFVYNGFVRVYKINLLNNSVTTASQIQILSDHGAKTPLIFGDFNGDGLTDFITPKSVYSIEGSSIPTEFAKMSSEQQIWWEYLSTGTGFSKTQLDLTSKGLAYIAPSQRSHYNESSDWEKFWSGKPDEYSYTEYGTSTILAVDINHDGISDLVSMRKFGTAIYSSNLWHSQVQNYPMPGGDIMRFYITKTNANGTRDFQLMNQTISLPEKISPMSLILNSADFVTLNKLKTEIRIHDAIRRQDITVEINNKNFSEGRVVQVDNGSGVTQRIEYSPMIADDYSGADVNEAYFTYNNNLNYPYYTHRIIGNHYLTSKIHTFFEGKVITTEYKYYNAIQHLHGKGFMGFQKMVVSDPYESIFLSSKYTLKNFFKGLFWKVNIYDPTLDHSLVETTYGSLDPSSVFSRGINTWQRFNKGTQYLMLSTTEKTIDYLKNTTQTKSYKYDTAGDLLLLEASSNHDNISISIEKFSYTPAFNNGERHFFGKISDIENTSIRDGDVFTTKVKNHYNTNGALEKKEEWGNNTTALSTEYTYYPFGEVESTKIYAQGLAPQIATYQYDATKRFVWKKTSPDLLINETNFDAEGKLISEVSPLGLTTHYSYDNWGNINTITDYLGKKTFIEKSTAEFPGYYQVSKTIEGGMESVATFDRLDREIEVKTKSINDSWIYVQTQYDAFGKVIRKSEPFKSGDQILWNLTKYDDLNRPVEYTAFNGKITTTCYEGLKVSVEDGHRKIAKWVDPAGKLVKHQDGGGTIYYKYHPNGSIKEIDYDGIKTKIEIDGWGNRKKLVDPSAGTYHFQYDNFGRIKREINPKGETTYTYDDAGKLTKEVSTDNESTNIQKNFEYDPVTQLPTAIYGTYNGKEYSYRTFYDNVYYRIIRKEERTPDFVYENIIDYDEFGRIGRVAQTTTLLDPSFTSSSKTRNVYDSYGLLRAQIDEDTGQFIYELEEVNARGLVTGMKYGNGYEIKNTYTNNTFIKNIRHHNGQGNLLEIDYIFDEAKGLIRERQNYTFGKNEQFDYDELDRLLNEHLNGALLQQYTYDEKGRMTSNSAVGKYEYNQQNYQLDKIQYNEAGTVLDSNRGFAQVSYNSFKQPVEIVLDGKDRVSYEYSILKSRSASYYGSLSSEISERPNRKYYSADKSIEIVKDAAGVKIITYVVGDPYTANYIKVGAFQSNGLITESNYFLHRDNQATILAISRADGEGSVVEKRFFDAWGNLKDVTISGDNVPLNSMGWVNELMLDRGYTGHEHLTTVGLIHMNGRIYDPALRRFMSPDNYVQDIEDTQKFNRYGYVWNNPLSYTDVTGEYGVGIAIAIGVAIAITVNGISNTMNDVPFWYGAGRAGTIGGITAAISFGIGSVATSAFSSSVSQAAFQAGMHGLMGGIINAMNDGNFFSGFASGMVSSLVSSGVSSLGRTGGSTNAFGRSAAYKATMIAAGGLSGGLSSAIAGGDFWVGVRQGIITAGLNHLAHSAAQKIRIHSNAKEWLKNGGYEADEYIGDKDESIRDGYVNAMRNNVIPLDILYNDAGNPKISYNEGDGSTYGEYDKNTNEVFIHSKAFNTNKDLFLIIMHEGIHAWDDHHGLLSAWAAKGYDWRALTETRAYEMMRYFDSNIFQNYDHSKAYDMYSPTANSTALRFRIMSYPKFFNNIQR